MMVVNGSSASSLCELKYSMCTVVYYPHLALTPSQLHELAAIRSSSVGSVHAHFSCFLKMWRFLPLTQHLFSTNHPLFLHPPPRGGLFLHPLVVRFTRIPLFVIPAQPLTLFLNLSRSKHPLFSIAHHPVYVTPRLSDCSSRSTFFFSTVSQLFLLGKSADSAIVDNTLDLSFSHYFYLVLGLSFQCKGIQGYRWSLTTVLG